MPIAIIIGVVSFAAGLALAGWIAPLRARRQCLTAVRALEAGRLVVARATLQRLLGTAFVPATLTAALRYNLGVATLRSGEVEDALALLEPVGKDEALPAALRHASLCHAAIAAGVRGRLERASALLFLARRVERAGPPPKSLPPLAAAAPEISLLAEAVLALHQRGRLPEPLLEQRADLLALDAHSLTALRVLRAYGREVAGDDAHRVLEELLAVAAHGRPHEFEYLTSGLPAVRMFLWTRAA